MSIILRQNTNSMTGRLVKAIAGFYYADANSTLYECKAKGAFRNSGESPTVGDIVEFDPEQKIIEKILPRKNLLTRPDIANIDKLFIVSSYSTPSPNLLIIDRLIAIAEFYGIEPLIVFNKSDMGDFSEWGKIYSHAGFKTFITSVKDNIGIESIRLELKDCICAFTGNSGVGKSSLLNLLFPELALKTGEVSEKLGRGKHTTRCTELFSTGFGGYVADTPGFSSVDVFMNTDFKEQLPHCFREFGFYIGNCRFTSCSHTSEKGCAVCEAAERGEIEKTRFESYVTMYNELKDLKSWNQKAHF